MAYRRLRCKASNLRNRVYDCRLDDVNLVPTMRQPFDVLAEGLVSEKNRDDRIRTCDFLVPNQAL